MSIDWITVAAQLANFLVLVWLLKRFLYRPILDGIDAREAEITARMEVAARAKEEASRAETEYRNQLAALQSEQASASEAERRAAQKEKDALLSEARERIERERAAWATHRDDETRNFVTKLHRAGGQALLELTRKAVFDLADETLEARIAAHLAGQIETMDGNLKKAAGSAPDAVVLSRAPLDPSIQQEIRAVLQDRFDGIAVRFDTDATQSPGLALRVGGAQLAWTVDTYIDDLDTLVTDRLTNALEAKL
ncbi:F0F1 ATP synthase subunit B [Aliishimia ponticola]|uniref:ATP synthase subunit b n=1 Tax=Aliishimia ponticola TaxID=2499833 RepID=A0A4S4NBW8_9RHOB|nr:F0F1 ATP synthase subunit B [Aliishimia ponticola]THH36914.1 F0F1 ATP synthase subunit B [Aliishimia ponticola]